ncbi:MAG: type II CAAX prenyl endopeptidase Rce1 family protein [Acidimicrobiia bacterium]
MTAPAAVRAPWTTAAAAALAVAGCAVLLVRPALLPAGEDPTARLVLLFVTLGAVGALWPVPHAAAAGVAGPTRRAAAAALALGCAAFLVGRLAMGGPGAAWAAPLLVRSLVLNSLAAVAEEAFFRRLVYGVLERPWGTTVAVAGSAAAFAVVHVTVWGWWVLPLDLAAGLLLSWQRAASGRWTVPAATHVLANVLALL